MIAGNNTAAVLVLELLLEWLPPAAVLALAPPQSATSDWQMSLADAAERRGVVAMTPGDVNAADVVAAVAAHNADLLLSVYYTQLFREPLLAAVPGGCLNFHPSLLPLHRGHAPVIWAIVEGDDVTGLSVHHVDSGIDTGPIVYRRSIPIHPLDTGFQLHQKMNRLVAATAADLLRRYAAGSPIPAGEVQSGEATLHSRRDPQVNHVDWALPAERIRNVVRALAPPLPGAFARLGGRTIVIAEVEHAPSRGLRGGAPGMVEVGSDGVPVVATGDGAVRLLRYADADGTPVRLETGEILV